MQILFRQYDLVKERRETLLKYCESLSPAHCTFNHDNFGGRSIVYLLVHVANVYQFWLGHFPKIDAGSFAKAEEEKKVGQIRGLYSKVDTVTEKFLTKFNPALEEPIVGKIASRNIDVAITPLQLFTHVITHEYHHKGQVLSMSRQLGYTPVDTDIIRFD
jgi:uncharacterized damage-inducible protein DinB